MIGTDAWVQVVNDEARAEGGYRARNACGRNAWKEEKDREKANRVAQQVRRAAALTAELSAQSEEKVAMVCDHPLEIRHEPAEHIEAPDMGAGGSHPQAEIMQHSPSASVSSSRQQGKTKLRCGNNSRVKSVKSCGEVETTGKHAPRKKSVSEGRRRKHGGSSKDSQVSSGRRRRGSRRNSAARSGT